MGCPVSTMMGFRKGDRVGDAAHPGTIIGLYSNGEAKVKSDDGRVWTTEARFLQRLDANAAPQPMPTWAPPVAGTAVAVTGNAFAVQPNAMAMQPQPVAMAMQPQAVAMPAGQVPVAMATVVADPAAPVAPVIAQAQAVPVV